ncbi:MAG: hypothetical protein EOO04_28975, partial [Chitinophagaceae bacterium]
DYGVQKGSGNKYDTVGKQRSDGHDLQFNFSVITKINEPETPDFSGPFVHGPRNGRFIYIDIGTAAGQAGTQWSRRLKIPLRDIVFERPDIFSGASKSIMITSVAGTGKDGGPNCGTVKPFPGWNFIDE